MDKSNLIRMLIIAAAFTTAGRRWRVPYLQAGVRIVVGSVLLGFSREAMSWPQYLFAALGLAWIGLGTVDIWRQRTIRNVEGS